MRALFLLPLVAALVIVGAGRTLPVEPLGPPPHFLPEAALAYAVTQDKAFVHDHPGLDSPVIGEVSQHAILFALGPEFPHWRHVSGDGWDGWVLASQLTPDPFMAMTTDPARLD